MLRGNAVCDVSLQSPRVTLRRGRRASRTAFPRRAWERGKLFHRPRLCRRVEIGEESPKNRTTRSEERRVGKQSRPRAATLQQICNDACVTVLAPACETRVAGRL